MSVDLYRLSSVAWAVRVDTMDIEVFRTIEEASEALEHYGIPDEQIDIALSEMAGHNHTRANFGVNKTFIFSDNARPNELLGVA